MRLAGAATGSFPEVDQCGVAADRLASCVIAVPLLCGRNVFDGVRRAPAL